MELQLSSGTVERDGEELYWELAGLGDDDDREVVVLSHGAGGSHAVWYQQVPALCRTHRVLTWDSRGFGNSTNHAETPTAEAAAADLAAILDEHTIERPHLVGQSMGGWHIGSFAMSHPTRVRSLVFADTVGGLWTPELREALAEFNASGGLVGDGPTIVGGHRALWPGTAMRDAAHAFLYQALGSFHDPPLAELRRTIDFTIDHADIAALDVPVLFVAGTYDQIFPADLLAASASLIPGARYVEIPAAGHSPYFEQPDAWNDAVGNFLNAIDAG
ncbi:MAG: alpha/beta fold hydrolase [Acidimicrobiales bacterium]